MTFTPDYSPPSKEPANALWFVYDRGRLLVKIRKDSCIIPQTPDLKPYQYAIFHVQYLGSLDGRSIPYFTVPHPGMRLVHQQ